MSSNDFRSSNNLTLITGGARSGKSELAELIAHDFPEQIFYLATMQSVDDDQESQVRIEKHRSRRPSNWKTIECFLNLDQSVLDLPLGPGLVIIDCLSLYLSNILLDGNAENASPYEKEEPILIAIDKLLSAIAVRQDLEFVVVTNEVGSGIVPHSAVARAFRDFLGVANRQFAEQASIVWLMVSGLKLRLK